MDLAAEAGLELDAEQGLALDVMLSERGDRWAAFEAAIIEPRQNGKTGGVLIPSVLYDLFLRDVRLVVWTAHRYRTTQEAFADIASIVTNCDYLRRRVKRVLSAAGDESIHLMSGSRLDFLARTSGSGRGLSGGTVVLDEALFLQPQMMGALLPTLSAQPDPQVRYGSSAGLAMSDVLRSIRDRGRTGTDPSLAYVERCAPNGGCAVEDCDHAVDTPGCALDDVANWYLANPALGRRISVDYIAAERRALPVEEFARERLGWWDEPSTTSSELSLEAWQALASPDASPAGRLVLGADVAPGHVSASVYVFGGGPLPVGELVERGSGSAWLTDRLEQLVRTHDVDRVVVDPAGPVGSLVPALQQAGLPLHLLDGKESVRACGAFTAAARDKAFRHRGEPDLDAAVMGARPRAVGDGWKWSRRDSTVDISALVAATNAYWLASTRPEGAPNIVFI